MTQLERPAYLSPSSIETFTQCPLKYKLSKIDKLDESDSEATLRGKFVHEVLERLFLLPAEDRTLLTARALMREVWDAPQVDEGKPVPSWHEQSVAIGINEKELKLMRWKAWWGVENYFKMEDPTQITPGGVETALLVRIAGVPIKGFVDRWDPFEDGISIVDYKTGRTPWKQDYENKYQQLLIYADGVASEVGLPARQINLLYVKDSVRLQKEVTDRDLTKMRKTVTSTWQAVTVRCKKGEFEPTTNKFCNWCTFKPICPAWN